MSELGDIFNGWKEEKQKKRASNLVNSLELLNEHGIEPQKLSSSHFRIGEFDFWPSTGKYLNRKTGRYSRGVRNLIKALSERADVQELKANDHIWQCYTPDLVKHQLEKTLDEINQLLKTDPAPKDTAGDE